MQKKPRSEARENEEVGYWKLPLLLNCSAKKTIYIHARTNVQTKSYNKLRTALFGHRTRPECVLAHPVAVYIYLGKIRFRCKYLYHRTSTRYILRKKVAHFYWYISGRYKRCTFFLVCSQTTKNAETRQLRKIRR